MFAWECELTPIGALFCWLVEFFNYVKFAAVTLCDCSEQWASLIVFYFDSDLIWDLRTTTLEYLLFVIAASNFVGKWEWSFQVSTPFRPKAFIIYVLPRSLPAFSSGWSRNFSKWQSGYLSTIWNLLQVSSSAINWQLSWAQVIYASSSNSDCLQLVPHSFSAITAIN